MEVGSEVSTLIRFLRITPSAKIVSPATAHVSIDGQYITWQSENDLNVVKRRYSRRRLAAPQLLDDFRSLVHEDDKALLRFARRYGPLGLCKHGFALGHRNSKGERCYERDYKEGVQREWLVGWVRYSSRADGVLSVAEQLRDGKKASEQDWLWLYDKIPANRRDAASVEKWLSRDPKLAGLLRGRRLSVPAEDAKQLGPLAALASLPKGHPFRANLFFYAVAAQRRTSLKEQRQALARVLQHWLDDCETSVSVAWSESGLDLRLGMSVPFNPLSIETPQSATPDLGVAGNVEWVESRPNRLLNVIGVRLLSEVLLEEPRVPCDICGEPYPFKRVRSDRANVCPKRKCKLARNRARVNKSRMNKREMGVDK